ncbi:MAG: hypothetical protein ACK48P_08820 [Holosporales bacterium]
MVNKKGTTVRLLVMLFFGGWFLAAGINPAWATLDITPKKTCGISMPAFDAEHAGLFMAIFGQESGGDYQIVNKDSGALGIGQVMPANVPSWTKECLGQSYTPAQFLACDDIQLATVTCKLSKMFDSYTAKGEEGFEACRSTAAEWYSGQGSLKDSTAPQAGYPSILAYTVSVCTKWAKGEGGTFAGISAIAQATLAIEFLKCWSCDVIESVVTAGVSLGKQGFDSLRFGLISLMLAVEGLFILWYVFKIVTPFGSDDRVSGTMNSVMSGMFVTMMLASLLASGGMFWRYIYTPAMLTTIDLSSAIITASGDTRTAACPSITADRKDTNAVAKQISERVSCQVRKMSESLGSGMTIGWAMWNRMNQYPVNLLNPFTADKAMGNFLNRVNLFFSGLALIGFFFFVSLILAFGIIDVFLRITIIITASPLMLAGYRFQQTRGFASWGLKGFLQSALSLALMSTVTFLGVALIETFGIGDQKVTIVNLGQAIENDKNFPAPTINTVAFWYLITIAGFLSSFLPKMPTLAQQLTGSLMHMSSMMSWGPSIARATGSFLANNTVGKLWHGANNALLAGGVQAQRAKWQAVQAAYKAKMGGP